MNGKLIISISYFYNLPVVLHDYNKNMQSFDKIGMLKTFTKLTESQKLNFSDLSNKTKAKRVPTCCRQWIGWCSSSKLSKNAENKLKTLLYNENVILFHI